MKYAQFDKIITEINAVFSYFINKLGLHVYLLVSDIGHPYNT